VGHDRQRQLIKTKQQLLDSLRAVNQPLWRVATLNIFPDFVHQPGFATEIEFYGKQYFAYANLAGDRAYDDVPDVTQGFENYMRTLMQIGASQDQVKQYTEEQLAKLPTSSRTYRMALGGLINAAKAVNSYLYPNWVKQYLEMYRNNGYGEISRLDYEMKKAGTFTPGFEAPDLVGMTPDSSQYSLAKMRGKVVLVDFWASWCGPCRREMPNVKANYTKYKDKGFDILGVSLDREIGAWKGAIQSDGLEWHHISDLKGWQSAHAALYSITSIPQTVLVDKEGRIIARNIRGEQLGEKLKEIFGN
jgi:thiol-disulfide isomerase/thioredoxin